MLASLIPHGFLARFNSAEGRLGEQGQRNYLAASSRFEPLQSMVY